MKCIFFSYIYAKRPSSICIYCCSIFRHFLFNIIFFANLHFFHGFSKLHENQNILDMNFCNSEHPYLPWGHFRCHTKFGPDRFSCLNVYWIQRNRQTDKQSIYIYKLQFAASNQLYTNIQLFHITIRNFIETGYFGLCRGHYLNLFKNNIIMS